MRPAGRTVASFLLASSLATFVFLSEVSGAFRGLAFVLGIVGATLLAAANGATGGRTTTSVVLAGVVGTGYVGGMYWYTLHNFRLPPIPQSHFWHVPIAAVLVGLVGYAVGYLLKERLAQASFVP